MKYHRFVEAAGGWAPFQACCGREAGRRRLGVAHGERRVALRAGAAAGGRRHRGRAARPQRPRRRHARAVLLRARRRRARELDAALAGLDADPRRQRRRVPPAAVPDRVGRPQPPRDGVPGALRRCARARAAATAGVHRHGLGGARRLRARDPRRRPGAGVGHDRHPRHRLIGGRRRGAGARGDRQGRGGAALARGDARGRRAHPRLRRATSRTPRPSPAPTGGASATSSRPTRWCWPAWSARATWSRWRPRRCCRSRSRRRRCSGSGDGAGPARRGIRPQLTPWPNAVSSR
jgi:hypothetical protein